MLNLLIDTGASISIIFKEVVNKNEKLNLDNKIKINGISGATTSQGSTDLCIGLKGVSVKHKFFLMNSFDSEIHGVLGSDFFQKYNANINYENSTFSLNCKNNYISLPMLSKQQHYIKIPARCEVIKNCRVDKNQDCVVLPEEVGDGIFIAGVLARPKSNMIPIKILNTRDTEVTLKNFYPKLANLTDYETCYFSDNKTCSVKRVDELLNTINIDHLNKDEKFAIQKICAKYSDVFQLPNDRLATTNIYKQKIHVKPGASPAYVKPYRLPHAQKTEIHKQIEKMLHDGVIEEAKSAWSAPLLIVPKKADKTGVKQYRVVIDYRKLNQKIEDEKFPLPSITEILDSLSGATYFSHLDLSQGYYQIELDKDSRPCTAFTTERGQYQMTRLPMGLKVSSSAFSKAMSVAMSGLSYESCFVYLDDLVIFGNSVQNHNKNLIKVLERLRKVNLKLNPKKCDFLKREILYLGHIISADGIFPDKGKIETIQQYPVPKDANEIKRFVAFANYYRRFIPNFSQIAAPLNNLTRKNVPFTWSQECQTAFEKLKNALVRPPILQFPNFSKENNFILKTDASGYGLGAVLSNMDHRPVAYASRSLNKAERNYCTIEKELLAIVWAVKHFRPYLFGRKFTILSDHKPLLYLFGMANPSSRLTKFRLVLEEYDFTIQYIKGKENVIADALSRIELTSDELKRLGTGVDASIFAITRAAAKKIEKENGSLNSASHKRTDHPGVVELIKRPEDSCELCVINKSTFDNSVQDKKYDCKIGNFIYTLNENVIYMKQDTRSTLALRASLRDLQSICKKYGIRELVIIKNNRCAPLLSEILKNKDYIKETGIKVSVLKDVQKIINNESKQIILNDFHLLPTGGHAGINRMFHNLKRYYYWKGLRKDVEEYVKKCDDCQRYKYSKKIIEPMTITTTPSVAFQRVYLDLVGPLEPDFSGNKYILTLQCDLSKFVECYPIENKEAVTVAQAFVENFILRYGVPDDIVSDQGTEFLASIFQEICKLLQINKLNSTAYHHQTLGSLENSHKSLGAYLRMQICKHQGNWSTWVPFWCFSYNNSVHSETRYTPHELVFGKTAKLPSNILDKTDPLYNFDNYPAELKYRLQQACSDARNNLIQSKNKRKDIYDIKSKVVNYKNGDKVLLRNEAGTKVNALYNGPYTVISEKSPNIIINIDNKPTVVHKNRVKKYYS